MGIIKKNRECPYCYKDCGETSQYYPFNTVVLAECKTCGKKIVNDFIYPDFIWIKMNWKLRENKYGSVFISGVNYKNI